jgi:SMODS-associated and fused to various effectors sensor domain/TIR domain
VERTLQLRLRPQGEEVLLAMRIRAFLSHKREDEDEVAALRQELKAYGAGGYKDIEDLRLGVGTRDELRRAIFELTGGFIWWGTHRALGSTWINELEIPNALTRAFVKPPYPIVPLLVDISPGADADALRSALRSHNDEFLGINGVVLSPGEDLDTFRGLVARRYVSDAIKALPETLLTIAFRALSEPDGRHDLTFDWRHLLDPERRELAPGAFAKMVDALANAREAFQVRSTSPELRIDMDLPLPLAYLVGYEWRITTRLRLEAQQRTGSSFRWINADGDTAEPAAPNVEELGTSGPVVVVASCGDGAGGATRRYAEVLGARRLVTLHVEGLLDDAQIRGLARTTARELRSAGDGGADKHLLIVGPTTLATFTGAAANAVGRVVVPFWNGTSYVEPTAIG